MSARERGVWVAVADIAEFGQQSKLVRKVRGNEVLLCRVGQAIVAVRNACTHLGHPLGAGRLRAGTITCPFHGACFDLSSGRPVSGPAVSPLRRYPVKCVNQEIFLDIEDPEND